MKNLNVSELKKQISYHKNKFRQFATVEKREFKNDFRQFSYEIIFIPSDKKKMDQVQLNLTTEDKNTSERFNSKDAKNILIRIEEFLAFENLCF